MLTLNDEKNSINLEIPIEIVLLLPNDQDLGMKVRELYYSLKNQENADPKRNDHTDVGKD